MGPQGEGGGGGEGGGMGGMGGNGGNGGDRGASGFGGGILSSPSHLLLISFSSPSHLFSSLLIIAPDLLLIKTHQSAAINDTVRAPVKIKPSPEGVARVMILKRSLPIQIGPIWRCNRSIFFLVKILRKWGSWEGCKGS